MRRISRTPSSIRSSLLRSFVVGCGIYLAVSSAIADTDPATAVKSQQNSSKNNSHKNGSNSNVPFELKGARIGDDAAKIASDFNIDCDGLSCAAFHNMDQPDKQTIPDEKKRFAGYIVLSYDFEFSNKKVGAISVKFYSGAFSSAFEAISAKYGKPSFTKKSTLQNSYGATVISEKVWWTRKSEAIILTHYDDDFETGSVMLVSKDYLNALQKKDSEQSKAPGNI